MSTQKDKTTKGAKKMSHSKYIRFDWAAKNILRNKADYVVFGLSENGVVFSFQPYEISCFAAGTFHFTIPYERLKPYLTDRAKWCINMGCERLWLEKVGA